MNCSYNKQSLQESAKYAISLAENTVFLRTECLLRYVNKATHTSGEVVFHQGKAIDTSVLPENHHPQQQEVNVHANMPQCFSWTAKQLPSFMMSNKNVDEKLRNCAF